MPDCIRLFPFHSCPFGSLAREIRGIDLHLPQRNTHLRSLPLFPIPNPQSPPPRHQVSSLKPQPGNPIPLVYPPTPRVHLPQSHSIHPSIHPSAHRPTKPSIQPATKRTPYGPHTTLQPPPKTHHQISIHRPTTHSLNQFIALHRPIQSTHGPNPNRAPRKLAC